MVLPNVRNLRPSRLESREADHLRAPETRTVTFLRSEHPHWGPNYWQTLVGLDVRMPAAVDSTGHVLSGFLVAAEESSEKITLTFSDLAPED